MSEKFGKIEVPIWVKRLGLVMTLATLAWLGIACASDPQGDCGDLSTIGINYQTDELVEMKQRGVVLLDIPSCDIGVDLDLLDVSLEKSLNAQVPEKLSIGGSYLAGGVADIEGGRRYIKVQDLPTELEVMVIEEQELVVVPVTIESITAEGALVEGQSMIVLQDLLSAINSSTFPLTETNASEAGAGMATTPEKDLERNKVDGVLFALGFTAAVSSLLIGLLYFNSKEQSDSVARTDVKRPKSIKRREGDNYSPDPHVAGSYSNSFEGPYKAGDVLQVRGGLAWEQIAHARNIANLSALNISGVMRQVGFTDPDFEERALQAIERAQDLENEYQQMREGRSPTSVTLSAEYAGELNRMVNAINTRGYSDPPSVNELETMIVARIVQSQYEKAAGDIHQMSRVVTAEGEGIMSDIDYYSGSQKQQAQAMRNLADHERTIKADYARIDVAHEAAARYRNSILPDNVE